MVGTMSDNPFDPPSNDRIAALERTATINSVQSSLYMKLKWRYPAASGKVAWYLIWLAHPRHKRHDEARSRIEDRSVEDIQQLIEAVRKSRGSEKATEAWTALCDDILKALGAMGRAKLAPALAAAKAVKKAGPGEYCIRNLRNGNTQVIREEFLHQFTTSGWEVVT